MTDDIGQQALRETAHQLADALSTFESVLLHADVQNHPHSQFAARSRSLGAYLKSALRVADDQAYPQSFAMLRIALEHHVVDRLLFLADRHEQIIDNVDAVTWRSWEPSRPPGATSWKRTKGGKVRIVWPGVRIHDHDGNDAGQIISIYYQWWTTYDPFAAGDRDRIALGHPVDPDELHRHVLLQHEIWRYALAWRNPEGEP